MSLVSRSIGNYIVKKAGWFTGDEDENPIVGYATKLTEKHGPEKATKMFMEDGAVFPHKGGLFIHPPAKHKGKFNTPTQKWYLKVMVDNPDGELLIPEDHQKPLRDLLKAMG